MNRDVTLSTIGNELMMLDGRVHLSQGEFATAVGISPSALRRWESDTSCPKAKSLKKVIEILLSKGAFSQGEEQVEAMHLWELANKRGLKVPFDEAWFRGLMQDVGGVPCTTGQPIDQGNEENLIVPPSSDGGEDEIGVRHRTGASPVPTAPVHVPKRSGIGGKRKRLLQKKRAGC